MEKCEKGKSLLQKRGKEHTKSLSLNTTRRRTLGSDDVYSIIISSSANRKSCGISIKPPLDTQSLHQKGPLVRRARCLEQTLSLLFSLSPGHSSFRFYCLPLNSESHGTSPRCDFHLCLQNARDLTVFTFVQTKHFQTQDLVPSTSFSKFSREKEHGIAGSHRC